MLQATERAGRRMTKSADTSRQNPEFLFIGSHVPDAAISKLKAAGIPYGWKRLDSGPENWAEIYRILLNPALRGVICKFSGGVYNRLCHADYDVIGPRVLTAITAAKHVVLIHEALYTGVGQEPQMIRVELDEGQWEEFPNELFERPKEQARETVNKQLSENALNVITYRTNAEASVISASFIEDNERNLLFRMYVPAGRLYAAEADKLLSLFRDWLTQVRRHKVRQDGYTTSRGQIYEFFGDDGLSAGELPTSFGDFSTFLERCVNDPESAEAELVETGLAKPDGAKLVQKYAREARRIHLDLKHEWESRMLTLRHSAESEIADATEGRLDTSGLDVWVEGLLQAPSVLSPATILQPRARESDVNTLHVTINQQVFHSVENSVIRNVAGVSDLSTEATELLRLISRFGEQDSSQLESALLEFEDEDAKREDRVVAKHRLKTFLYNVAGRVGEGGIAILQRYVEMKIGLGQP
jgi:hypothetical protein